MAKGEGFLKAGCGDDPATIARLNQMIAVIQDGRAMGFECDEMVEAFMREMRKAMRRGLLTGAEEIMARGDPFYEEDEIPESER